MARNILVVEDDRNISDLIRMYLEKEGFDVRIAYDGGKAVEEYDRQAPDMVLLDIMLPVMDGWSVCAHIREKAKTPIIMLTAKSEVNDRITGLEMGADDYLVKPFEMKELMARINAVLRRSEIPDDTRKRLVFDKLEINLDSYELFRGFISGLYAGNYDISHVFIDNLCKTIGREVDKDTENFLNWLDAFGEKNNIKFTVTISASEDMATEGLRHYL